MKRKLLIISGLSFLVISANAQITITSADIATPTKLIYQATDTTSATHNLTTMLGSAGANQVWNMDSLHQPMKDTLTFESYAWAPNALFSTANLAVKQGWQSNYGYFINSDSSFVQLGVAATVNLDGYPTPLNQTNTPAEKLATFPFSYDSSFVNNYNSFAKSYFGHTITYMSVPFLIDSVSDYTRTKNTVLVDAWGTLSTPLGIYQVIRSKETLITTDSANAYVAALSSWHNIEVTSDSVTTYTWWANGLGYPLAQATMDSTGNVSQIQWLVEAPVAGIKEYSSVTDEKVYPNPAQDEINFASDASNQKEIQVYDIAGRLMDAVTINNNITTFNTSAYVNGLYTYSVIGKDNTVLTRGKFVINK